MVEEFQPVVRAEVLNLTLLVVTGTWYCKNRLDSLSLEIVSGQDLGVVSLLKALPADDICACELFEHVGQRFFLTEGLCGLLFTQLAGQQALRALGQFGEPDKATEVAAKVAERTF